MILTVHGQRSLRLVSAKGVGSSALVHPGLVEGAVDDGEGGAVLPHLDLHLAGVLQDLALEVPGDLRPGVAGKPALEPRSLTLLQSHLLHLSDELRGLLSFWANKTIKIFLSLNHENLGGIC